MQAALRAGLPILGLWGRKNRFSRHALVLTDALYRYEKSLCKGCGHSGFLTYDQHENTQKFRVESVVCVSCEGLEQVAKNTKADDEWPGTKTFSVNTMDDLEPEAT
jgi:hypothetical protein